MQLRIYWQAANSSVGYAERTEKANESTVNGSFHVIEMVRAAYPT